jgi:hypothetical protein
LIINGLYDDQHGASILNFNEVQDEVSSIVKGVLGRGGTTMGDIMRSFNERGYFLPAA